MPVEDERLAYIAACIEQGHSKEECEAKWSAEALHPDFQRILGNFITRFIDGSGVDRFHSFVDGNSLDVSKAYRPEVQFTESFQWVEPLITAYRQDKDAKYYKLVCLTANISMNNNDYSDYEKMMQAAPSMAWRPVNINHTDKWLPFPQTRVDFVRADDLSVEATLRVDNQDKWLQDALDSGQILHPSIEGRPLPGGMDEGYHFTGIALLERGVSLPGDPMSSITPLMLNESLRQQVYRAVDGKVQCDVGTSMLTVPDALAEAVTPYYIIDGNDGHAYPFLDYINEVLRENAELAGPYREPLILKSRRTIPLNIRKRLEQWLIQDKKTGELTTILDLLYDQQTSIIKLKRNTDKRIAALKRSRDTIIKESKRMLDRCEIIEAKLHDEDRQLDTDLKRKKLLVLDEIKKAMQDE